MMAMKRFISFFVSCFFMALISVVVSGCDPVSITALTAMGTGAGVGVMGTGMYNASKDGGEIMMTAQEAATIPMAMVFQAGASNCRRAIVEVLATSGETVEMSTETMVRTAKTRINEEAGMMTSIIGHAEVYVQKSITLMSSGASTEVLVQVDIYRKTMYTDEEKKEWPEQKAAIRYSFFEELSEKIPLSQGSSLPILSKK